LTVETVAAADKMETPVWVRTLLSLAGTLAAMSVLVWVLGANPLEVVEAIVIGALGNPFNIGQTVVITGILILTALAAAIPFSARLWNVGGDHHGDPHPDRVGGRDTFFRPSVERGW